MDAVNARFAYRFDFQQTDSGRVNRFGDNRNSNQAVSQKYCAH